MRWPAFARCPPKYPGRSTLFGNARDEIAHEASLAYARGPDNGHGASLLLIAGEAVRPLELSELRFATDERSAPLTDRESSGREGAVVGHGEATIPQDAPS